MGQDAQPVTACRPDFGIHMWGANADKGAPCCCGQETKSQYTFPGPFYSDKGRAGYFLRDAWPCCPTYGYNPTEYTVTIRQVDK